MPDDLVPISALEHWSYCPRQCGLIHLEQTFSDNVYTVRGIQAHERVHEEGTTSDGSVRVLRGVPLWSERLGLIGKADVVELRGDAVHPVEYKVGRRRAGRHEDVQLAAQAMCLEEMLGCGVHEGALFYWGSRHRHTVPIDSRLRSEVVRAVDGVRAILENRRLPNAVDDARCPRCSLVDVCVPSVVARVRRTQLLHTALFRADGE